MKKVSGNTSTIFGSIKYITNVLYDLFNWFVESNTNFKSDKLNETHFR